MFEHTCTKRIRYGETDQMGFLYYGNYGLLYEIGRTEAIRSLGVTYSDMEKEYGVMMPVLEVKSRYMKPLKYDELATIKTILKEMPTKFIVFNCEIYKENGELAHKAEVKLCFVDMKTVKMTPCPQYMIDKLSGYFDREA